MNYAIILAGGVGKRLWPLSSESFPKQFLCIDSDETLFRRTIKRLNKSVRGSNICIATNKIYKTLTAKHSKGLGIRLSNLLFEPSMKNTLAPIGCLAAKIFKDDPDAVIVVLPSDHLIEGSAKFTAALRAAFSCARKEDLLVTFGIKPTRPETGYGYIKINPKSQIPNSKLYRVEKFLEKPDAAKARKFLKDGHYFWNSGIFVFKAKLLLDEIKRHVPSMYNIIMAGKCGKIAAKRWEKLPSLSIDYGIMEKTKECAVLPVDYAWSDLGSWQALAEITMSDKSGKVLKRILDELKKRRYK